MPSLLTLSFCASLSATAVQADTPIDLAPCGTLIAMMPDEFMALDVLSCTKGTLARQEAEMLLIVDAPDVLAVADRLQTVYGMGEIAFRGFDYAPPAMEQKVIAVDESTDPAAVLSVGFSAQAHPIGDLTTRIDLGAGPAVLTFRLMRIP